MEENSSQMEEKYNWWLVSNSLVKRSLAVVGHYFIWYLIIFVPLLIIGLLVWIAIWIFMK